ncbi:hypothetical protein Asppvi_004778 [Aspergillus pseudoviridinutans]|uniref:Uncharacterized protein n=1 Tax=Aspergillus pseudoviridinutans TaxID=1517512 RepID=A0A9P3BDX4_9EURO|nr:uncharacterized protein Asppvi_004778 [Aspergillus pseudoviridinutans]GIJ85911.1 hypothetical protein Asppvi_004778 [Aspergillus pseudoviridinutans]
MAFAAEYWATRWFSSLEQRPDLLAAALPKPVHPAHRLKKSIQVEGRLQEDDAAAFGLEVETELPPLIRRKEDLAVGFGEHLGYPHHHCPMHEYQETGSLPAGGGG